MPDSVISISNNAFQDCPNLFVACSPNSYTHNYCLRNGVRFWLTESPAVSITTQTVITNATIADTVMPGTSNQTMTSNLSSMILATTPGNTDGGWFSASLMIWLVGFALAGFIVMLAVVLNRRNGSSQ